EAAALAAALWVGRGNKNAADKAAVDAMRLFFNAVPMDGVVVIGEGEKDEAPMLFNGEQIGTGSPPVVDVAVDPIDGTRLVADGDVAGAITAARRGTGVDLLYGIGGTPEGVVAAAALKCLGGVIQGRLYPRDEQERKAAVEAGYDLDRVLTTDDLVRGDDVFFACTGITDGALVQGVR